MEVDASKKSEKKDKAQEDKRECPAQASSAPTNPAAVPSGKKGVGGLRAKIRHYFPTRRSCRIVPKYLDDLRYQLLREQVALAVHESFLEIISSPTKGRGLRTNKEFFKDQFVVEYRGEVLSMKKAKRRENLYARNPTIGCFMFYFKLNESTWCIDATRESEEKGRLVNHSRLSPNLKAKVLDLGNKHPQLCLMALRDIEQGEELTFDYGDRTPLTVGKHPWLLNT